ncbi:MAG TPA: ABC transporter substrate-binding protein [Candidatus Acidoferrales bacterium]|nr:ABC transporter substrate-binding protein [Candidatus Acidoferrales bacterium]
MRKAFVGFITLATCVAFAVCLRPTERAAAQPAALADVSIAVLGPSTGDWLMYIAQQQDFFAAEGLNVHVITAGSPPNTTNLLASGSVNFMNNGTDSEIAAIAHQLPLKIVASTFVTNPYTLVTAPSVTTWAQLRNKTITLGTKQDVTAIVLRRMAEAQHLDMDRDFSIVLGGTSAARFAAVSSGNVQGAILTQPFDILAQTQGMHVLAQATTYLKSWVFSALAVNTNWASTHRPEVVKYIRALRRAAQYGYTHRQEAVTALVNVTHVDQSIAQRAYALDFGQWHAFSRTAQVDPRDLQAVMDAIVGIGILPALVPVNAVLDPTYANEAAGS